jgi:hypothetical protein
MVLLSHLVLVCLCAAISQDEPRDLHLFESFYLENFCDIQERLLNHCPNLSYNTICDQEYPINYKVLHHPLYGCNLYRNQVSFPILILIRGSTSYYCYSIMDPSNKVRTGASFDLNSFEIKYISCEHLNHLGAPNFKQESQALPRSLQGSCRISLNLYSVMINIVPSYIQNLPHARHQ